MDEAFAAISRLASFLAWDTLVAAGLLLFFHPVPPKNLVTSSFFSLSEARRSLPNGQARVSDARLTSLLSKAEPPRGCSARLRRSTLLARSGCTLRPEEPHHHGSSSPSWMGTFPRDLAGLSAPLCRWVLLVAEDGFLRPLLLVGRAGCGLGRGTSSGAFGGPCWLFLSLRRL